MIYQRNKISVGIQYWQNIIVDVIYIKKLKKKSQLYDFVIFFSLVFYTKKKTQVDTLFVSAWPLTSIHG